MATNQQAKGLTETDPQETQEWLDALTAVIDNEGTERAHFLLDNAGVVGCADCCYR